MFTGIICWQKSKIAFLRCLFVSLGLLPGVYGPWVLNCTDCCHLPKQMYTTVYPASHRPGKYVQTFGTFKVSLSATWGYQPVYDSSQVGRWHLANKESGCRVGGESIAEPCRPVSDEPLTCFFYFFFIFHHYQSADPLTVLLWKANSTSIYLSMHLQWVPR